MASAGKLDNAKNRTENPDLSCGAEYILLLKHSRAHALFCAWV